MYSPVTDQGSSKLREIIAFRMADAEMSACVEERLARLDGFPIDKYKTVSSSFRMKSSC